MPLVYLLTRAFQADLDQVAELVFRARTLHLFLNTAALTAGVLVVSSLIA
ncbi:MAG: iron ABC transporter permease, partial [Bacteroidetes bacterium]|nr:iron ABC transporter permease [Bacteroidota bacterium]